MTPNAIYGLMRVAKCNGHRLSDVVSHAVDSLRKPCVTNVYAYIRSLLTKAVDYSFLAAQMTEKRQALADAKAAEESRKLSEASLLNQVGKVFRAPDGRLWTVENGVLTTKNATAGYSIPYRQAPALVKAILEGLWLRAVHSPSIHKSRNNRVFLNGRLPSTQEKS